MKAASTLDFDLMAIIPARLGSSRLEEKVFQEIAPQETLLRRKIQQLRLLLPADRVVVNTESEKNSRSCEFVWSNGCVSG